MAHEFQEHRKHHAEKHRVGHIARGYAHGGAVHHDDEIEDVNLIRKTVKAKALKRVAGKHGGHIRGRAAGGRLDRKGRKRGDTHVNVMIGPQGGGAGAAPVPVPVPPMGAGAPPMPPRPPMAGPPGMPPGMAGLPPGVPPPVRARGGRIKDGPAWQEGLRNGTPQGRDRPSNDDAEVIAEHKGVKKVRTYRRGGPVNAAGQAETRRHGVTHGKPAGHGAVATRAAAAREKEKPVLAGTSEGRRNPYPNVLKGAGSKSGLGRIEKSRAASKVVHAEH